MFKKLCIYILSLLLITSCSSSNEDPTNIELEVLRVSLLEKELIIDELHQSLDENNRQTRTLTSSLNQLEASLAHEKEVTSKLLEGQDQILTIQDTRPDFYHVVNDVLYILTVYEDQEIDYTYEELYRYAKDEPGVFVYKGTEIQFKIGDKTNITSILDNEKFQILDNALNTRFTYEIDLNEPLIELTSTLYLDNTNKQESYVLLWKYIEEEKPTLYSIIAFDYRNIDDIVIKQHNLITQNYEISDELSSLVYVDVNQEANTLISLNLKTGDKEILLLNKTEPFSMYKNDGNIYYFDQENDGFLRYDNN